ncbi:hypothetical protein K445DRAFT_314138 [Daldinia sp. EC12]|nr:hypothetical protein K445DRAFT_314138 [Daldinia sp. EC12]
MILINIPKTLTKTLTPQTATAITLLPHPKLCTSEPVHWFSPSFVAKTYSSGPSKSFVGFRNTIVFGTRVDSFGLSATKESLIAISKIVFPTSLKDLKTFIGLAGYIRSNVPSLAEIERGPNQKYDLLLL